MLTPWLPWISAALVAALLLRWSGLAARDDYKASTDLVGGALITLAWHSNVWPRIATGYPNDTIFNLSVPGRVGLVVLTLVLVMGLLALLQLKTRLLQRTSDAERINGVVMFSFDLLLTVLLFIAGLTLVPQLHYTYYHLLFDLPNQWIVKPLSWASIGHVLSLPGDDSLAIHATGLCGWWLFMSTVLSWLRKLDWSGPAWRLAVAGALASIGWHLWAG